MEQRCETTKTPRERTHNPEVAGSNPRPCNESFRRSGRLNVCSVALSIGALITK
jgi:hypothetical protein